MICQQHNVRKKLYKGLELDIFGNMQVIESLPIGVNFSIQNIQLQYLAH